MGDGNSLISWFDMQLGQKWRHYPTNKHIRALSRYVSWPRRIKAIALNAIRVSDIGILGAASVKSGRISSEIGLIGRRRTFSHEAIYP